MDIGTQAPSITLDPNELPAPLERPAPKEAPVETPSEPEKVPA